MSGSATAINKALLIAVVVLAVALVGIIVYFVVIPNLHKAPTTKPTTQAQTQLQTVTPTLAFEDGVKNWLGLVCVYNKYGPNATLGLIDSIYSIAFDYIYAYEETNNATYLLVYPVAQYSQLTSEYPACSVTANDTQLVGTVMGALNNINVVASELNISSNLLGTPLFIVFNRDNNVTYVMAGASPFVFYAINYSRAGTITELTYQGQVLGYGYRANPSQVMFINQLLSQSLVFGNPKSSIVVFEFLDPTCPYCSIFQVEYGKLLDQMVGNGTIYFAVNYFPTHVLGYGCSSPTIAQMLGPYCG